MNRKVADLPLDAPLYAPLRNMLKTLVTTDPELTDIETLKGFLHEHQETIGTLTLAEFDAAPDDVQRMMVHYMVLGATALGEFHELSRSWLQARGYSPPPWDQSVARTAMRMIPFHERVGAVVEWEPEKRVTFDPQLSEHERRWVLAMAIGAGERPQWSDEEIKRYAAYLIMSEQEFQHDRQLSDEQLAVRYQVPIEAVQYRRSLPDEITS